VGLIVVVDDERSVREFMQILLERVGHEVYKAADTSEAIDIFRREPPDLVFTDLMLPTGTGMDVLRWLRSNQPEAQVIMMTAFGTAENAVEAMRLGAYDYQVKPVKVAEIRALTTKAMEKVHLLRNNRDLTAQLSGRFGLSRFVGSSQAMLAVERLIEKVAPTRTNVLVEGESGTGKELVARAIHEGSPRRGNAFVAVNCGAIPETLIEAELFGHAAGAFTGANKARRGLFEAAHSGTLLLDEIGELPQQMQVKLLRVLQERSVRRVGDDRERAVDVRIVAATNRDLQESVEEGSFREDLFYRLNVVRVRVPPLRERIEDIPLLATTFAQRYATEAGKTFEGITDEALRALTSFPFPGNVRELENYMERAVTLAADSWIRPTDLPAELQAETARPPSDLLAFPDGGVDIDRVMEAVERQLLEEALHRAAGVKTRAAQLLGITFRSFRYRLKKHGMGDDSD